MLELLVSCLATMEWWKVILNSYFNCHSPIISRDKCLILNTYLILHFWKKNLLKSIVSNDISGILLSHCAVGLRYNSLHWRWTQSFSIHKLSMHSCPPFHLLFFDTTKILMIKCLEYFFMKSQSQWISIKVI